MRRWLLVVAIVLAGLALGLLGVLLGRGVASMPSAQASPVPEAKPLSSSPVLDSVSPLPSPSAGSTVFPDIPYPSPNAGSTILPDAPSPSPEPTPTAVEPETIFTEQVPQYPSQRWGVPYELGTRFQTTVDGTVTAVRVYGADTESGLHAVRIWHWDTAQVIAGPYEWEYSGPGWHEFVLPAPLEIEANTDYVVVVSTGTDPAHDFVSTPGAFNEPVLSGHLVTHVGSGVATETMGTMPAWLIPENRCYFRDIVFVPGEETAQMMPSPEPQAAGIATTYYVATNGDDAWSGTLPQPNPQGTDGPWRTIQHAANVMQPGDTVYVRSGTYYEWVWLDSSDSGTEDAPITFAAYPGEEVILDGAVYPTDWQEYSGDVWWTDASDIGFGWEGEARLIWQDEVWLAHSPGLGSMVEGTWWFDTGSRALYVWARGGGDPGEHEIAVSSLRNGFHLDLASWIVLDGFHLVHHFRSISQMDSIANQGRHMEGLTVRDCLIEHVGEGVVLAGASWGIWGYTHHSRIEQNVIRDTQSDAMWVGSGTDHLVRNNSISDVKQAWWRGFVSAAIILGNADDSTIEGNRIYDAHALGIDVEHVYGGDYGNRNTVSRNLVHNIGQHGIAILGANDTRIENNMLYDVETFSILVNTEAGPALGNEIVNNTIYRSHDRAIAVIEAAQEQSRMQVPQDTVIRNNIFVDVRYWAIFNEGDNTSADYNLYWQAQGGLAYWLGTTYYTLAELQSVGQEAHGLVDDPELTSPPGDMRLQETSPAIDAGSDDWAPAVDYWGRPRPWDGDGDSIAIADIGAHEWVGPLQPFHLPLILKRHWH